MKQFLIIIAVLASAQIAKSASWQYLPENLILVSENLNKDLYSFNQKIVSFSISKNKEVSHLQILNNICPSVPGGFSCLAMPSVVLNASFAMKHVETDSCGVHIYESNKVDVSNRFLKNDNRSAQIRFKDFSNSICEMVYLADIQLELLDITVDAESNETEVVQSTMLFNYIK